MPYLIPGLIAGLALPAYYLASSTGLPLPGWIGGFVRHGGYSLGAHLVGFGIGRGLGGRGAGPL